MKKSFKSLFAILAISALIATPAFACAPGDPNCVSYVGGSGSTSFNNGDGAYINYFNRGGVVTDTNSFHSTLVTGSGTANGSNYSGGQASSTNTHAFGPNENTVQITNYGESLGGNSFAITTGNKNSFWIIPPTATALGHSEGDVSQGSKTATGIAGMSSTGWGIAGSQSSQGSAAGFEGGTAGLLIGKNKGPQTGSFAADSVVTGTSFSDSYKGMSPDGYKYIGSQAGAGNSANTDITTSGNAIGSGYAFGNGKASSGAALGSWNGNSSAAANTNGAFCYQGNGAGNVYGLSEVGSKQLPAGAIVYSTTNTSVNVFAK